MVQRGKFILFEGLDRCGKSTQVENLVSYLELKGEPCVSMKFPDRSTLVGQMINSYLLNDIELDDRAVHLLFAANRWELSDKLCDYLDKGINVVCDRYSYSGMAYSSVSDKVSMEWCMKLEEDLPQPDIIFFIDITVDRLLDREGFGAERYENIEFQRKVYKNFIEIIQSECDEYYNIWNLLDGNSSIEELSTQIFNIVSIRLFKF
jgi:dTMP kinase